MHTLCRRCGPLFIEGGEERRMATAIRVSRPIPYISRPIRESRSPSARGTSCLGYIARQQEEPHSVMIGWAFFHLALMPSFDVFAWFGSISASTLGPTLHQILVRFLGYINCSLLFRSRKSSERVYGPEKS